MLFIQPPSVYHATGYEYCPHETIQIAHNGCNHWVLLSSINGRIKIYDSLNTELTISLKEQMKQLFSPGNECPQYEKIACHPKTDHSRYFTRENLPGTRTRIS